MDIDYSARVNASLLPLGSSWLWDWKLIVLHSIPDLVSLCSVLLIASFLLYIYKFGHLKSLVIAYPSLWRLGIAFMFFIGVALLGNVLEVWIGGVLYYFTGVNRVFMAISSSMFAFELYKCRNEIAAIGRVMGRESNDARREEP